MVGILAAHVVDDLSSDRVRWKPGRCGYGHLALVRVPVVGVVGELTAGGFSIPHEDAGLLAHGAVEAIHDVALRVGAAFRAAVRTVNPGEVRNLGEPGGIGNLVEMETFGDGLRKVEAQLALRRTHQRERRQTALLLKQAQGLPVA